jgi:nucleoside-diphosphate-sugar epimerase
MRALITGGGGFVGLAVVRMLVARGVACGVVGRRDYPALEQLGVTVFRGDIQDKPFLNRVFKGYDTVFHVAAKAGIWGPRQEYEAVNVGGTANVIDACRVNRVRNLVYTSTPSVVFNHADINGGDETLPYGESFLCHYAESKARAEQLVLAANSAALLTCALRPHLIWGPGDPHLVPRLLDRGRRRQLRRVGDGTNLVDIAYIDNVAEAHLLAAMLTLFPRANRLICGAGSMTFSDGSESHRLRPLSASAPPMELAGRLNGFTGSAGFPRSPG